MAQYLVVICQKMTSYYDSCQNSGLFKMKPLVGKSCISISTKLKEVQYKFLLREAMGPSQEKKFGCCNQKSSSLNHTSVLKTQFLVKLTKIFWSYCQNELHNILFRSKSVQLLKKFVFFQFCHISPITPINILFQSLFPRKFHLISI